MTTILVTGATGNIGTELVHLLSRDLGVSEVRAATRDPREPRARLLERMGPGRVRAVRFTTEPNGLEAAFIGVDVLCLVTPLGPRAAQWQEAVLRAARGVRRIIKVSVDAAGSEAQDGPGAIHWAGEQTIRKMDVEFAIVRPTIFMQHFLIVPGLHAPGDDRFFLPIGNGRMAMLDCRDIAAAVARLATVDAAQLPPEPVLLTGPEALSGADLADSLSAAAGREIRWEADPAEFEAHSKATGSPTELAAVYAVGEQGAFATVETAGFEMVVGRWPTSFAKFASDYAAIFRAN